MLSFPVGSAGGRDGLLPQHIKDLLSLTVGEPACHYFAYSLNRFCQFGDCRQSSIIHVSLFIVANLLGLNKADGGIRHIAIDCTLHCLLSKCVCLCF